MNLNMQTGRSEMAFKAANNDIRLFVATEMAASFANRRFYLGHRLCNGRIDDRQPESEGRTGLLPCLVHAKTESHYHDD